MASAESEALSALTIPLRCQKQFPLRDFTSFLEMILVYNHFGAFYFRQSFHLPSSRAALLIAGNAIQVLFLPFVYLLITQFKSVGEDKGCVYY